MEKGFIYLTKRQHPEGVGEGGRASLRNESSRLGCAKSARGKRHLTVTFFSFLSQTARAEKQKFDLDNFVTKLIHHSVN